MMRCQWCGRDNAHNYKELHLCWICYHKKKEDQMEAKYDYSNPIDLGWLGKKTYTKKDGTEGTSYDGACKEFDMKVQATPVQTKYGPKLKLTGFKVKDNYNDNQDSATKKVVQQATEIFNEESDGLF